MDVGSGLEQLTDTDTVKYGTMGENDAHIACHGSSPQETSREIWTYATVVTIHSA